VFLNASLHFLGVGPSDHQKGILLEDYHLPFFFLHQHHVGSVKGSLFHVKTLIAPTAHPEEFSSTGAS